MSKRSSGESKEDGAKRTKGDGGQTVLHSYWRSSCSWRVRIALAMKKVDYDYVAVHLVKDGGQQLKPEYTELNPAQEVPTLSIDGLTMRQSLPIIEYLEETRPDPALLPKDAAARVVVRELSAIIASGTQPVQNLRVLRKFMSYFPEDDKPAKKVEWGQWVIAKSFTALEAHLTKTAGKYCVGDDVTLVDLCLVPQVYNANRFKVDMSPFPTINKIVAELEKLEAFQAAHPDKQPDAQ